MSDHAEHDERDFLDDFVDGVLTKWKRDEIDIGHAASPAEIRQGMMQAFAEAKLKAWNGQ